MSISQAQRARLGIFMIMGGILLTLFIAIPLGLKLRDNTELYYSYFGGGESMSGLGVGAEVKYNGVKIGTIDKIILDPKDFTKVKVVYRINRDIIAITEGMEARTGLMGITGLLYIEITGGSPDAKVLPENSKIPSKPSLMHAITGKAEIIIGKVEILLNHLNMLTNPDSLTSIKEILDNVAGITHTVDEFVKEASPDIKKVAATASTTMEKIEAISGDVQSITSKLDREIDFKQMAGILDEISSSAKSLKNLSETLDLTVMQSREDISSSLENLREALENVNELSRVLLDNPSLILRGDSQKERRIK